MASNPEQDFVLKTIKSRDVHFVRFWFTDVLGHHEVVRRHPQRAWKTRSPTAWASTAAASTGFCRTAGIRHAGVPRRFHRSRCCRGGPESNAVARMFCSIRKPTGEPFEGDPRHVLARAVARAQDMGYVFNVGPELEYYYFKDAQRNRSSRTAAATSTLPASTMRATCAATPCSRSRRWAFPWNTATTRTGPAQHEIDLRFTDALSMADAVMTYKLVVKEIAMKHGVYASFMPKPMSRASRVSGMHVHHEPVRSSMATTCSSTRPIRRATTCPTTAKQFLAGILKYAPEYCPHHEPVRELLQAPACRRGSAHLPVVGARATAPRWCACRGIDPNREVACRLELRSPDPSANPYLAFSVMLAAGLAGIEEGLEPPAPVEDRDLFTQSRQELRKQGFQTLPESLGEAVELFAESKLMHDVLGEHICNYLVEAKRAEWDAYQSNVSEWERSRYLAVL